MMSISSTPNDKSSLLSSAYKNKLNQTLPTKKTNIHGYQPQSLSSILSATPLRLNNNNNIPFTPKVVTFCPKVEVGEFSDEHNSLQMKENIENYQNTNNNIKSKQAPPTPTLIINNNTNNSVSTTNPNLIKSPFKNDYPPNSAKKKYLQSPGRVVKRASIATNLGVNSGVSVVSTPSRYSTSSATNNNNNNVNNKNELSISELDLTNTSNSSTPNKTQEMCFNFSSLIQKEVENHARSQQSSLSSLSLSTSKKPTRVASISPMKIQSDSEYDPPTLSEIEQKKLKLKNFQLTQQSPSPSIFSQTLSSLSNNKFTDPSKRMSVLEFTNTPGNAKSKFEQAQEQAQLKLQEKLDRLKKDSEEQLKFDLEKKKQQSSIKLSLQPTPTTTTTTTTNTFGITSSKNKPSLSLLPTHQSIIEKHQKQEQDEKLKQFEIKEKQLDRKRKQKENKERKQREKQEELERIEKKEREDIERQILEQEEQLEKQRLLDEQEKQIKIQQEQQKQLKQEQFNLKQEQFQLKNQQKELKKQQQLKKQQKLDKKKKQYEDAQAERLLREQQDQYMREQLLIKQQKEQAEQEVERQRLAAQQQQQQQQSQEVERQKIQQKAEEEKQRLLKQEKQQQPLKISQLQPSKPTTKQPLQPTQPQQKQQPLKISQLQSSKPTTKQPITRSQVKKHPITLTSSIVSTKSSRAALKRKSINNTSANDNKNINNNNINNNNNNNNNNMSTPKVVKKLTIPKSPYFLTNKRRKSTSNSLLQSIVKEIQVIKNSAPILSRANDKISPTLKKWNGRGLTAQTPFQFELSKRNGEIPLGLRRIPIEKPVEPDSINVEKINEKFEENNRKKNSGYLLSNDTTSIYNNKYFYPKSATGSPPEQSSSASTTTTSTLKAPYKSLTKSLIGEIQKSSPPLIVNARVQLHQQPPKSLPTVLKLTKPKEFSFQTTNRVRKTETVSTPTYKPTVVKNIHQQQQQTKLKIINNTTTKSIVSTKPVTTNSFIKPSTTATTKPNTNLYKYI